jgi:hypothetical protein
MATWAPGSEALYLDRAGCSPLNQTYPVPPLKSLPETELCEGLEAITADYEGTEAISSHSQNV